MAYKVSRKCAEHSKPCANIDKNPLDCAILLYKKTSIMKQSTCTVLGGSLKVKQIAMNSMRMHLVLLLLLGLLATMISTAGCGSAEPDVDPMQQAQMKVLGILYGKFLSKNRGQAPASREQFIQYLDSHRASWEKIVSSADQLITSSRDGKPLVMLYGKSARRQSSRDTLWIGYESEGVNGRHQVLNLRGDVEEMDSEQISQLFTD